MPQSIFQCLSPICTVSVNFSMPQSIVVWCFSAFFRTSVHSSMPLTSDIRPHRPHISHITPGASHLASQTSHLTPHNHMPLTSHRRPQTSHLTPHTSVIRPHTTEFRPKTSHLTPNTSHLSPDIRPQTLDLRPRNWDLKPVWDLALWILGLGTSDLGHNLEPGTCRGPGTWELDLGLGTWDLKPGT